MIYSVKADIYYEFLITTNPDKLSAITREGIPVKPREIKHQ